MKKRRHAIFKLHGWANSILHINAKYWTCSYCGNLLKDRTPFSIVFINSNPTPYVLCSESCLKIQIIKLEAKRTDASK